MNGALIKLAVYTTIYRGVEPYLSDWYRSVRAQTDQDYQLWIGLDDIEPEAVSRTVGGQVEANWVRARPGDSPAQIRQRAMAQIVEACDAVVLVDSDDILEKSRLAVARTALETSELAGCALRLVDERGQELGITFDLPAQTSAEEVLPRYNVFGLSNSAYRSDLLRRCLPIPADVVLVDWFLATQAWLRGAKLAFDSVVGMDYRQHGTNMVRVRGPFTGQQVARDTKMVREHFRFFQTGSTNGYLPKRLSQLERTAEDVEFFYQRVVIDSAQLTQYVTALNALTLPRIWWVSVAHPVLKNFWRARTSHDENS